MPTDDLKTMSTEELYTYGRNRARLCEGLRDVLGSDSADVLKLERECVRVLGEIKRREQSNG